MLSTKTVKLFGLPVIRSEMRSAETSLKNVFVEILGADSSSGIKITEDTALKFSAVYACVKIISETIASLPRGIYIKKDGKRLEYLDQINYRRFVRDPNPKMTSFTFWETMMTHVLLWGNAYARIIRDSREKIRRFDIIQPNDIEETTETIDNVFYKVKDIKTKIRSSDMLHISGLSFNGITGLSPIGYMREAIGSALAQQKYIGSFYKNGATVKAALTVPGALKPESYERIREQWKKNYGGTDNQNKVAVLEGGAKLEPMSIKPVDAEFIATARLLIEEIARCYRVPLHLLQELSHSTNNNIEHQSIDFIIHTVRPWLERIEAEVDKKCLTEEEKDKGDAYCEFNIDAILRGDTKTRSEMYKTLFNTVAITGNEIRQKEGLNPLEGGDNLYYPTNMAVVGTEQEQKTE